MSTLVRLSTTGEELDLLRAKWGWLLAFGIVLTAAGILALANVLVATAASVFFVGITMLIGGAGQIVYAFQVKGWGQFFLQLLIGALYVLAGLSAFNNPLLVSAVLTLLLAVLLIAAGVFRIASGFSLRPVTGWGWLVAAGVLTVVLGILILAGWPLNSLWLLGILLAVDLIFYGVTLIFVSLALRRNPFERGSAPGNRVEESAADAAPPSAGGA